MPMGLACCAIEMMAAASARFDIARFGSEVMRFSPRQADVMIVAATVTYKMALAVKRIYDQMPEPKWVIAMGACASSGGMYRSYAVLQGIDLLVPVDVYVSGCPPRPQAHCLGQVHGSSSSAPGPTWRSIEVPRPIRKSPLLPVLVEFAAGKGPPAQICPVKILFIYRCPTYFCVLS